MTVAAIMGISNRDEQYSHAIANLAESYLLKRALAYGLEQAQQTIGKQPTEPQGGLEGLWSDAEVFGTSDK
jgi:hypothetical protein